MLKPELFMVDFEIAVIKSIKKYFRAAIIKGCLSQSLFKNLIKHHLNVIYLECPDLQLWFKKVFTLALLPKEIFEERFIELTAEMKDVSRFNVRIGYNGVRFYKYILDTYFEGKSFPQKLWNHYDTDSETTNNNFEADNFKMNSHCNSANTYIKVETMHQ